MSTNASHRPFPYGVSYEAEERKEKRVPNGYVFICSHRTERECFERKVFAMPMSEWNRVFQFKKADILFLLNYQSNHLHGVFEATTNGTLNIEPYAFDGRFPAQVRVRRKMRCPPLDRSSVSAFGQERMDKSKQERHTAFSA